MAKEVTKAPTGLKITRTGNKFTASWKIGDKDYGDSQHFQYLINDTGKDNWLPKKKTEIGHKTTSRVITTIDKKDYYPNVDKKGNNKPFLYTIGFRVKGNRKKYTTGSGKKKKNHNPSPCDWTPKEFTVNPPKKPTLTVELDEELTNVCKFSWSAPYADDDSRIFTDVQWQTILVKNSSETDGSKLSWKGATFQEGTGGAESDKTITEDTEILYKDGNSYTRWFRVRSRGPRGVYNDDKSNGWVYKKHVYALSHQANVTGTSASETTNGGFQCTVDWTVGQSGGQNPIDKTTAQYTITIPDEGLTCPSGVSWNDANISRDTSDGDAAVFSIDDQLGKDQCLFIRVNTQHDSNITYGKPQLSSVGFLKDPSGLSVSTDNVTHKATIRATNASDVEDSILIVRYVPSSGDPIDIGVIPHGSSSVTVQCPNWDDQEAIAFDVYAIVGTAVKQQRDDGVDSYSVTARMRSQNTISEGGAVPVSPKEVSVNRVEGKPDTVRVDWDWPWSDAGSAEISWSDHDDAWESTDEPESFLISNLHASHWNISGLETGKTWYIRVRLIAGDMTNTEDVTYGPWSDISQGTIDLSSAPNKPTLLLSNSVIPEDGSTIASWVYTTTDNTAQAYAEVAIVENGEYTPIAHSLTSQHVTIPAQSENYTLSTGNIYNLVCRVKSASGKLSEWSEIVSLTVAEPITCEITQTSLIHDHRETNPREFEGEGSVEFETEMEEDFTKMSLALTPIQDLHGYDKPWIGGAGKNKWDNTALYGGYGYNKEAGEQIVPNLLPTVITSTDNTLSFSTGAWDNRAFRTPPLKAGTYNVHFNLTGVDGRTSIYVVGADDVLKTRGYNQTGAGMRSLTRTIEEDGDYIAIYVSGANAGTIVLTDYQIESGSSYTDWTPYENICPISAPTTSPNRIPYPYVQGTHTVSGITFTDNGDGTVTINGTATASAFHDIGRADKNTFELPAGTYTFMGSGNANVGVTLCKVVDGSGTFFKNANTGSVTFTTDEKGTYYFYIVVNNGTTVRNLIVKPQLEEGSTATIYRPYGENVQVMHTDTQYYDPANVEIGKNWIGGADTTRAVNSFEITGGESYRVITSGGNFSAILFIEMDGYNQITNFNMTPLYDNVVTLPENCNKVIVQFQKSTAITESDFDGFTCSVSKEYEIHTFDVLKPNLYDPANLQIGKAWNGDTNSSRAIVWMPCQPNQEVTVTIEGGNFDAIYWFEKTSEDSRSNNRSYAPPSFPYHVTTTATSQVMGIQFNKTSISANDFDGVKIRVVRGKHDGAICGGTVDLVSGVLTVDRAMVDLGTLTYTRTQYNSQFYYFRAVFPSIAYGTSGQMANMVCSDYETVITGTGNLERTGTITNFATNNLVLVRDDRYTDVQSFTSAVSGVQLVYELATPQTIQLTPQQIQTLIGTNKVWSEDEEQHIEIRIAESMWDGNVLTEMPLEVTVTGAGEGGITSILVERAEDYPMERPDETNFHGNRGDIVLQTSPPLVGTNQVSFDVKNLIGALDDGAAYNIVATVQDGLGQTDDAILPFEVHWEHQAEEPSAEIEIDEENLIAFITPIAPENADPEDVADIYRLSADRPELIVEGAIFGETYVDPYPALGDMGGHRIVTRTKNGDYITEDNQFAMVDSPELGVNPIENEDLLNIIDFEGRQIQFYWETNYSNTWAKDFQETQYLGGSIEGDWNPAVSRSGTLSSKAITVLDQEMLKDVRRLADYPGICHVRTADGSSYAADVQVSEDYTDDEKGMVTNYSLSITKVDPQGFEGMTREQWEEENPPEEEEEP